MGRVKRLRRTVRYPLLRAALWPLEVLPRPAALPIGRFLGGCRLAIPPWGADQAPGEPTASREGDSNRSREGWNAVPAHAWVESGRFFEASSLRTTRLGGARPWRGGGASRSRVGPGTRCCGCDGASWQLGVAGGPLRPAWMPGACAEPLDPRRSARSVRQGESPCVWGPFDPRKAMTALNSTLEELILRRPEEWGWFHDRSRTASSAAV
jgi:hypothetical protein